MSENMEIIEKQVIKKVKDDENNQDKKTDNPEGNEEKEEKQEKKELEQNKKEVPFINIRKISTLSDSVINYFVISISLFMYSAYNLGWFDLQKSDKFVIGYYIFAGIALYIIGVLNWYEGKELLFLFDFIFSFYFIILFFKKQITVTEVENLKLEGLFYILFFAFILIIGISSKEKGIIFTINYGVVFFGFVFLFADKFFNNNKVIKYIHCYAFIVSAGLLWAIGVLKLINNGLLNKSIIILDPSD